MGKQSRNPRANLIDGPTQAALRELYGTVDTLADENPEISFRQQGATNVYSARQTTEVFGPDISRESRQLVRVALEQTGLFLYSRFKPSRPEQQRAFRDTIQETPFEYSITTITAAQQHLSLLALSVMNGAALPIHNRVRHTFLHALDIGPDEDGLIKSSSLIVNEFGSRTILPELSLETSYISEEEYRYQEMVDSQVMGSDEAAEKLLSTPLNTQLTSEDPLIRARATEILEARKQFAEEHDLGVLTPSAMDIRELRSYIAELFG